MSKKVLPQTCLKRDYRGTLNLSCIDKLHFHNTRNVSLTMNEVLISQKNTKIKYGLQILLLAPSDVVRFEQLLLDTS